ncbi:class I SAM-dependent DNA methyltransferase [Sphingomonas sp. HDW15A]|uniref:class I SAM-dependent DNA methyltransferase n=1 Tax=Sphingomonas sp. HDW15A TaxID=2714942 RepID=UPI00140D9015|nr:class I SAM-dependent DNA methyltransferase [Sphingomonas sp. HDW15A]QIK95556.1 class I SAM-dependent DNA methyltransferase [Sphingomonas sp. HDW15A]
MNTIEIEENLDQLVQDINTGACSLHDFPFRIMEAYSASRNEVAKLRMKYPEALVASDITWPKKLLYRPAVAGQVQNTVASLRASLIGKKGAAAKNAPRFLMSTDGDEFLAVDLKTGETSGFDRLAELPINYDFLQPMFGVERYKPAPETAADVRAARHMAKFHDAIKDANPTWGDEHTHDLNIFMTRILFCMFAEDTGIFPAKLFAKTLDREAMQIDGSTTKRVIEDIFLALDIADKEARRGQGVRSQRIAADFPYVNGGLFRDRTDVPVFNRRARRLLLEAADLHWDQIHADIFGSMIQAIVQTDMRADFGMHYTSLPNIMKVLEPLFLNSLREQLTAAGDNVKALEKLVDRISRIRVFDPACGSGNFLIIAYRELRLIETEAFRRLRDVKRKGQLALADYHTGIKISSFYGIDPVDFACETAKLSLWISQYQMNKKLDEICTTPAPALPLTDAGNIVVGNALRLDWAAVCPPANSFEVYAIGNPPYLGSAYQDVSHKADIRSLFQGKTKSYKDLDYVACWFLKGAEFCSSGATGLAFVSTNSIAQGEQVSMLWPALQRYGVEIGFAYEPFKWTNNASKKAGVICVIISLRRSCLAPKKIFGAAASRTVSNINAYLKDAPNVLIAKRSRPISSLPTATKGNAATDNGNLILDDLSRSQLTAAGVPDTFIKPYKGSSEFIRGLQRWCLWIEDHQIDVALKYPEIRQRLENIRAFRQSAGAQAKQFADAPHRFVHRPHQSGQALLVARVSSERRDYIPAGIEEDGVIINDNAVAVYDAPTWLLSIVSARLHTAWLRAVGGRLKTDYRYSNTLVYNTFPLPALSSDQKDALEEHALNILRAREPYIAHSKTIAWLYNPETMPADLLQAHRDLDNYLETIYIGRPFKDDAERLEHLFKLYARMTKVSATKAA